jgi:hypothetical protein
MHALLRIRSEDLQRITNAEVLDVLEAANA